MRNRLCDVNDHLMMQLERLGNEDLKGEELMQEIKRSEAVAKVTSVIVNNANTVLAGERLRRDSIDGGPLPDMFDSPKPKRLTNGKTAHA